MIHLINFSIEILKTTCTTYEVVKGLNNYEAIDYGFKKYPSEIQAWLNSDDLYRDGAINTVMNAFEKFPDISWLTGTPSISNDLGVIRISDAHVFPSISKYTWTLSSNIFIQQESTFWRKKLYEEVGGISKDYRYANDYDLWSKFFKKELLYSIPQILASFRMHSPAQLSVSNRRNYVSEVKRIQSNYDIGILRKLILKLLMGIDYVLIRIPILRSAYDSLQFRQKFLGFPMRLRFDDSNQLLKC